MKRRDLILGAGAAGIAATSKLKAQTKSNPLTKPTTSDYLIDPNTERIIKNPLLYIYNIDTIEASFFVIRSLILNKNLNSKPSVDKESFWEWTINVKGEHWYGKYDFPKNSMKMLLSHNGQQK